MKLIYKDGPHKGKEVKEGDKVVASGGEEFTVTGIEKPHKPSSTGRINVKSNDNYGTSFFPSVFDADWIEREDQICHSCGKSFASDATDKCECY
jgi:hypothetical protein